MIRNPNDRWLRIRIRAAFFIAIAAGSLFYWIQSRTYDALGLDDYQRRRLADLPLVPVRTMELERQWVAVGFEPEFLIAPAGPTPCVGNEELYFGRSEDPSARLRHLAEMVDRDRLNRFPALILATELVNQGRYEDAEHVAEEALETGPDVFAEPTTPFARIVIVQLHHVRGVARLSMQTMEPPWTSLKNAIGGARLLENSGRLDRLPGDDVGRRRAIPTPNCKSRPEALTTDDLQNNLIVGYMKGRYSTNSYERLRELRPPSDATALRRLLALQYRLEEKVKWRSESQLWALANVVKLVDAGFPEDARLAVNAIQVIDWWTKPAECPRAACSELMDEIQVLRTSLLERALATRNVAPKQRAVFVRNVTRMLAGSQVKFTTIDRAVTDFSAWLPSSQVSTFEFLAAAAKARDAYPRWIMRLDGSTAAPFQALGPHVQQWKEAAASDFVATAAEHVALWSAHERQRAIPALRRLVQGSEMPWELKKLLGTLTWWEQAHVEWSASPRLWVTGSILIATVLWFGTIWWLVQLWERRMLRTSLYDIEVEQLIIDDAAERLKRV